MANISFLGICLLAYGMGCFNAGYYLVKWFHGSDIRETGSGNAGARYVGRKFGTVLFFLVLILDAMLPQQHRIS